MCAAIHKVNQDYVDNGKLPPLDAGEFDCVRDDSAESVDHAREDRRAASGAEDR